jgi:hypothetical protein
MQDGVPADLTWAKAPPVALLIRSSIMTLTHTLGLLQPSSAKDSQPLSNVWALDVVFA